MEQIKSVKSFVNEAIVRFGRARLQRYLLAQSDHVLKDVGFSRQLLEQGVAAWPWRIAPELNQTVNRFAANKVISIESGAAYKQADERHAQAA